MNEREVACWLAGYWQLSGSLELTKRQKKQVLAFVKAEIPNTELAESIERNIDHAQSLFRIIRSHLKISTGEVPPPEDSPFDSNVVRLKRGLRKFNEMLAPL